MGTIIRNGTVYDGTGTAPRHADIHVGDDGRIAAIGTNLDVPEGTAELDATGTWVTPGFIDQHTHYDAELEVAPGLSESVRHGVTTVLIGSCGLSMVTGTPEDMADMFCRVEGIPRPMVLPILEDVVDWKGPADYVSHLESLPLGPNVIGFAGHSTVRGEAMGMERALTSGVTPTADELARMNHLVGESLDAGLLGLSINLLPWDKMDGTRFRSRPTPSVYATFKEYRALTRQVRERDAVFQALPNLQTRIDIAPLMDMSRPRRGKALRTSLLTLMDAPTAYGAFRLVGAAADFYNRRLGAHLRFQALPTPFDMYTDGLQNPIIEEFGAGTEALHLEQLEARRSLMRAPVYRDRFRAEWTNKIRPRAYHRNLAKAWIVECPDATLNGKTFAEAAELRGNADALDAFMDLQATYGNDLRWFTVVANSDADNLEWIVSHPVASIGFSDAGAHLRNMAYYNFGLRMLKRVRDAERAGKPFMSVEQAVYRLSREIAEFLRIDAGLLAVGKRADLVVIDPERLDDSIEEIHEAPMAGFDGLNRLVRRNDDTVRTVMVNGRIAWAGDKAGPGLGSDHSMGTVLKLGETA